MSLPLNSSTRKQQTGLTIVEMLIAVALSMVLMAGVFQIFISSKQSYRVQNELGRLQENARFALDVLTRDVRMAGNIGCNQAASVTNHIGGLLAGISTGIEGFEQADLVSLGVTPNGVSSADVAADTDLILLKSANSVSYNVATAMADGATDIELTASPFAADDAAIVADCKNVDIFQVESVIDGTDLEHGSTTLSKPYGADAQVMRPYSVVYYIAPDENNNDVRNLYRRVLNSSGTAGLAAEPLIEGVEDMQIEYGENVGGSGLTTRYVKAGTADLDMDNVTAVRIHLLLATLDKQLASEPQTYTFNGASITSDDRRIFRTMTTTIVLRNAGKSS